MARILMCPPDFYGIMYEINPWMNVARESDHEEAIKQWRGLRDVLEQSGAQIELLPAVEGLPDLVFTANAALIYGRTAIMSRFKHPQRQGETPHDERWLQADGFKTVDPPGEFSFEGAGDALFCGDTLYAGYRRRSDAAGHQKIGAQLGVRVIPMELVQDRYYHLDTCFCPISQDEAIWYPPAFDEYGRQAIESLIPKLIAVEDDEAVAFACNAVAVGEVIVTNVGCPRLHEALRNRGRRPIATPLGEFVKAGGSAKCLTLRLDGEDAASWRDCPESA